VKITPKGSWRSCPFRKFAFNAVWLELVGLAHDLLAWSQALALSLPARSALVIEPSSILVPVTAPYLIFGAVTGAAPDLLCADAHLLQLRGGEGAGTTNRDEQFKGCHNVL
jgi:hypothetical protein